MVSMRGRNALEALHEPCFRRRPSEGAKRLECARLAAAFARQKAGASSPHSKRCRALSAPRRFMVPMRSRKTVEAFHEPEKARVGNERLRQNRFMAPIHVRILEVSPTHEH